MINNRKIDISRDFRFLFPLKSRNQIPEKMYFFPIAKLSTRQISYLEGNVNTMHTSCL